MKRPVQIIISIATRTIVSALLIVVAVSIFLLLLVSRPQPEHVEGEPVLERVTVLEPQPVMVNRRYTGYGTAEAMDTVNVPARVAATVDHVPENILAGVTVAKGQLLARLDASDFKRQLEIATQQIEQFRADLQQLDVEKESLERRLKIAEEDVALAEAEYERVREARMKNAATPRELDQARQAVLQADRARVELREQMQRLAPRRLRLQAQLEQQKSNQQLAQLNVDRCTIESPMRGVLQTVDVEPGESVTPGERVARIVDLSHIEVPLRLADRARRDIMLGDEVKLGSTGASQLNWSASVRRIAPESDRATRTTTVFVEVEQDPSSPDLLAPGMFVHGTALAGRQIERFVVPRRALRGEEILVVRDGVVSTEPVRVDFHIQDRFPELGIEDEQWAVLGEPLGADTLVVLDAGRKLAVGSSVTPVIVNGGEDTATMTARDGGKPQAEQTP